MTTTSADSPDGDRPSVGVDAADLEPYAAFETADGELVVYEVDRGDRWIQSDLFCTGAECA